MVSGYLERNAWQNGHVRTLSYLIYHKHIIILGKHVLDIRLPKRARERKTLIFMRIARACERQKHQARACVLSLFEQWLLF